MKDTIKQFQFTRPRGARRLQTADERKNTRFNSRAHAGRDAACDRKYYREHAFQFTRPRGARQEKDKMTIQEYMFQFTRPRGARLTIDGIKAIAQIVSIHAPTRGATSRRLPSAWNW